MPLCNPRKTVAPAAIGCGGRATVTIAFDAAASLCSDSAHIVLVLDRSSSMCPPRLCCARTAAAQLIDMVAAASGGGTVIGGGSRVGLVSFADDARADQPLTVDVPALHRAVAALRYGGATSHAAAFLAAEAMLQPAADKRRIVVLFTDGETTAGGDPDPAARRLRDGGVEIYCIGLATDPAPLERWASAPVRDHVAVTDDPAALEQVFGRIAQQLVRAGAREVELRETLHSDFRIVTAHAPTHGSVRITSPQSLVWTMDAVGLTPQLETESLSFDIVHTGTTGGTLAVNRSLLYTDREGRCLTFPSPTVTVDCCDGVVYPEPCPPPTAFQADRCRDAVHIQLPAMTLGALGRIVQVDATVQHVCPGRTVAVAVVLTELDVCGREHQRGLKTLHLPPLEGTACRDVTLRCIRFVVPELPDGASLCAPRRFRARILANYTDTDFTCCDAGSVTL